MPAISVRSLSKSYLIAEKHPGLKGSINHFFSRRVKKVIAVNNLSFEIKQGEIVGFLGSNGAGKTTTLKMLCGLIHPSSGVIEIYGHKPFLRQKTFLRQITLVMGQKQQLIWDLPPLDSLRVNAAIYGLSDTEAKKRIDELATMLELGVELTRPVRKLSLGQRMKAELLAALLHRPTVLFLDEPTLGLDINAQIRVREFLAQYNKKYGATILLTSHYMGDITSLCKRVLLIHQGELFHDGSLNDLTNRLSPKRCIKIELMEDKPLEDFKQFGDVVQHDGRIIRILIPKSKLSSNLSSLLNTFDVKDIEVTDPPIEELIGKILKTGNL